MFALVQVGQDYDYVESLDCLGCYDTVEAAAEVKRQIEEADAARHKQYIEYINHYVDAMYVPETVPGDMVLFHQWCEFVKSLNLRECHSPIDFRKRLKQDLATSGYQIPLADYNPPPRVGCRTMRIMELKIQTKLPV